MSTSDLPSRPPSLTLPKEERNAYIAGDIMITHHVLKPGEENEEVYYVSPKEGIGYTVGPPLRIVRAFDSDALKTETVMPDTIGCTPLGSETFVRLVNKQVPGIYEKGSEIFVLSYDPERRKAIAEEMSITTSELPSEHNFPALLPVRALRQSVLEFLNSGFEGGKLVAESLVNLTIINMLETLDKNLSKKWQKSPKFTSKVLGRILDFMEENLNQDISVNDLGEVAEISPHLVAQGFKQMTGKAPQAFLQERRVERAKSLLSSSRHPIGEIALACGFSTSNQFTKVFKRATGMTPSGFRMST
ncbi:MAG: AraC family transcriptional regulator [Exilibacterium sp.]